MLSLFVLPARSATNPPCALRAQGGLVHHPSGSWSQDSTGRSLSRCRKTRKSPIDGSFRRWHSLRTTGRKRRHRQSRRKSASPSPPVSFGQCRKPSAKGPCRTVTIGTAPRLSRYLRNVPPPEKTENALTVLANRCRRHSKTTWGGNIPPAKHGEEPEFRLLSVVSAVSGRPSGAAGTR